MKIAFILNDFPSITQTFVLSQINGIIEQGHDVDIYARRKIDLQTIHDEVHRNNLPSRIIYLPRCRGTLFRRVINALRAVIKYSAWQKPMMLFKALDFFHHKPFSKLFFYALPFFKNGPKKYDVIHCQFGTVAPMTLELMQIGALQGKLVISIRGHDITQDKEIENNIYHELFKHADLFLPVSHSLKEMLIHQGCEEEKITILHSGIDCRKFEYRERILISDTPIKLLSTARLIEMKGLEYSIRAVSKLINSGFNLVYNIIGEGELRQELEALVKGLGTEEKIRFLGWRNHNEVKNQLDEAHIFIAPSVTAKNGEKEGIPNAVKEAMAQGLPIIGTLHSGIPELVENNKSGYLVPERDADALAERLQFLCEHSEIWNQMGRTGRKYVLENFDINNLNNKLVSIYTSLK